jgi:hypothetical protein
MKSKWSEREYRAFKEWEKKFGAPLWWLVPSLWPCRPSESMRRYDRVGANLNLRAVCCLEQNNE